MFRTRCGFHGFGRRGLVENRLSIAENGKSHVKESHGLPVTRVERLFQIYRILGKKRAACLASRKANLWSLAGGCYRRPTGIGMDALLIMVGSSFLIVGRVLKRPVGYRMPWLTAWLPGA